MRKIRMKRSVAGRRHTYTKGDEVDVTDVVGRSLVDDGCADDITPDDYEPDPASVEEQASSDDGATDAGGDQDGPEGEDDELGELTVADLKEIAKERYLPTSGSKDDLIARIRASVEEQA